jgi:integrase
MKNQSKLTQSIAEYLDFRKAMGFSDNQKKTLDRFAAYCEEHFPNADTLTNESVRGWISDETKHGRTGMYNKISSLRLFAKHLGNGAYVVPTTVVSKKPVCTPYILTDDELSRLFTAADNLESGIEKGTRFVFPTMLRLIGACGLRPNEGRCLKSKDINFDTGELLISKTKAHRERIVVMADSVFEMCKNFAVRRKAYGIDSEYFFARTDGNPLPNYQFNKAFNLCWKQANPELRPELLPPVRPYDLRHRFASTVLQKWIDAGADLYAKLPYLRAYMGHEHFSQTAYYIHILPENILRSPNIDWDRIDRISPEVSVWKI